MRAKSIKLEHVLFNGMNIEREDYDDAVVLARKIKKSFIILDRKKVKVVRGYKRPKDSCKCMVGEAINCNYKQNCRKARFYISSEEE